jgi:hypothetical protein
VILWDVARASAFVAFACYTLVVAWGIALSARVWRPPAPHLAYHRFLASLGLVAVGIHIGALMLDRYARVTVSSLVGLDPRPGVVVVWALSLVHGIAAGTDSRSLFALGIYGASAAIVGGAAWYRWIERPAPAPRGAPARDRLPARAALEIEGGER